MKANHAPGPRGLPLLGHLPQYWRDRLGFLVKCADEYGDVVRLQIGRPTLLLTNPGDIRHVLVTHAERYTKTVRISGPLGRQRLGKSVLTSTGVEHLARRRMLQPLFHSKSLEIFVTVIAGAVQEWVSVRQGGERLDIAEHMRTLAQRIMTRSLFGSDLENEDALLKAVAVRRRYHKHIVGAALSVPHYQPALVLLQYWKAIRHIDAALTRALQSRRRSTRHSDDMLSQWVLSRSENGEAMTDAQIRAEALTFIDTGYETISAVLTWTWILLAQHPSAGAKISSESVNVLSGKLPRADDLSKLHYTTMVLRESMRLYPPAWNFERTAAEKDVLPSGVEVEPGTKLMLCQYVVHRNPRYFAEPESFKPERFEAGPEGPRFSYFPFGGGTHLCLGQAFAEMECVLVLAMVARHFTLALESNQTVKLNADFMLRPEKGLLMRVNMSTS